MYSMHLKWKVTDLGVLHFRSHPLVKLRSAVVVASRTNRPDETKAEPRLNQFSNALQSLFRRRLLTLSHAINNKSSVRGAIYKLTLLPWLELGVHLSSYMYLELTL